MLVIPAIDIRGGKVVRLGQGEFNRETIYSDSPVDVAKKWDSFGVDMIHVVDLDGAKEGRSVNIKVVADIVRNVRARIELGGGVRDEEAISAAINAGVTKIVVGTKALDEDFLIKVAPRYEGTLVAGIDARSGMVHTNGWVIKTGTKVSDLVKRIERSGIRRINYTDISKDGMLEGPNIKELKELIRSTRLDVVAAGGVSTIEDVKALKALEKDGLKGMIIGKALYEGKIDLAEAVKICLQKG
ncbi:MAG: 1-(5-phosphoribosyl)-5-[(5-phosphoribosylamino)methylideneamino]imidazole-4-carboxamide isomerase [Candidatus Omnitrophota bacterium]|nr:1-(5-phosphoribosyl)-5-[(5-phosphoribosylamino)methylideneamino]imidazole-4-carboxamide isomerase [Candidatus Omnitrophota bacterium]